MLIVLLSHITLRTGGAGLNVLVTTETAMEQTSYPSEFESLKCICNFYFIYFRNFHNLPTLLWTYFLTAETAHLILIQFKTKIDADMHHSKEMKKIHELEKMHVNFLVIFP